MIHINLMPWRDELRNERRREYFLMLGAATVFAFLIMLLVHFVYSSKLSHQQNRINYLQDELSIVNAQIAKLNYAPQQQDHLKTQLKTLTQLYNSRFHVVRFYDELIKVLPNEVYLTAINKKDNTINLIGQAQNNAQVTQLMENIAKSKWLSDPALTIIARAPDDGNNRKNFQLSLRLNTNGT